jgi:hypothetical protein
MLRAVSTVEQPTRGRTDRLAPAICGFVLDACREVAHVEQAGYPVFGHVHDSIICQVPEEQAVQCAAALLQA